MERSSSRSVAQAVLVALIALVVWFGFQLFQLWGDHSSIQGRLDARESVADKANKLKVQLQAMAGETASLASSGNANAQGILDAFKAQGVQLHQSSKDKGS